MPSLILAIVITALAVGRARGASDILTFVTEADKVKPKTIADAVLPFLPQSCELTLTMSPLSAQPACILKADGCPAGGCQLPRVIAVCENGKFIPSYTLCPTGRVLPDRTVFPFGSDAVEMGLTTLWTATQPPIAREADSPCKDRKECLQLADLRIATCAKNGKSCLVDADCGAAGGMCQGFQAQKLDSAFFGKLFTGDCLECHSAVTPALSGPPYPPADKVSPARSTLQKPIPVDGTDSSSPYDGNSLKPYIVCKGRVPAKDTVDAKTYRAECFPTICDNLDAAIKAQGDKPDAKLKIMASLCRALDKYEMEKGVKPATK
jgi:hypothetical protein